MWLGENMQSIGHKVLRRGDVIKSPKTKKSYIVVDISEAHDEVLFMPISARHQKKAIKDIVDWELVCEEDRRRC
jgi:hypothetical protein